MPAPSAELKAYYAARAPYYDAVYARPERAADIASLREYLPARFVNRAVLEVACGTGYWTQYIAPAASRMVATDATNEPMAFARLRPNVENVLFVQADAYHLPAELGTLEAAFAGLWLSHVPIEQRTAFFTSLHARLAPGSPVVLIDNAQIQCREFPLVEQDAAGNTYQRRTLRDGSVHRVLKNFPAQTELESMVAGAATLTAYHALENFWRFEYVYHPAS